MYHRDEDDLFDDQASFVGFLPSAKENNQRKLIGFSEAGATADDEKIKLD